MRKKWPSAQWTRGSMRHGAIQKISLRLSSERDLTDIEDYAAVGLGNHPIEFDTRYRAREHK